MVIAGPVPPAVEGRAGLLGERIRRRFHDAGLLPRLLVGEALVLCFLLVGGMYMVSVMARSLHDRILRSQLLIGTAVAEDLDAAIKDGLNDLGHWGSESVAAIARGATTASALDRQVARESATFNLGMILLDPDCSVVAAQVPDAAGPLLNSGEWLGACRESLATTASDAPPRTIIAPGLHVAGLAVRLPEGRFAAGLMDMSTSYPALIVGRARNLGGSGHADVVSSGGIDLFSTEVEDIGVTSDHPDAYRDLIESGAPSITEEVPLIRDGVDTGEDHVMTVVRLETVDWALAMGTAASEAFAPVRALWFGSLGFLSVLTVVAFGMTIFVGRRLIRPVSDLSKAARGVAEGNRQASIVISWGGEIGELAESLERMRLRLQSWGADLQQQVRERTSELEDRNSELRDLYLTLQAKEAQLRVLLEKVLKAQEDERKRISRELHDEIGQALSALSMGLERLEQPRNGGELERQRSDLEGMRELAKNTLGDLRRMTVALRPAALDDLGLVPAIRRYAELYLEGAGVSVQIRTDGSDEILDPSQQTVVYRVVQEAINNIARHAHAGEARINLARSGDSLEATVEDDGLGFDTRSDRIADGVGLQGMAERAVIAGGTLDVRSARGRGTVVTLRVPVPAEKGAAPV